jgi:hypothetical protein
MKLISAAAALLLLVSAPGCDRFLVPPREQVYAAWEEGLTLGYEDPSLESGLRQQRRQQVRVKEARPTAAGLAVTKTFSTLSGRWETRVLQKDGGVTLMSESAAGIRLLPEGFPDRVGRWESRGAYNWVVGRAWADLPGVRLAEPGQAVGVWVESTPVDAPGSRTRTLYLPDIGEAQTLTWIGGRWVTTNILVTRGFTDSPAPSAKTSGSTS